MSTVTESKGSITDEQIAALAKSVLTAAQDIDTGRTSYLRYLIADTQAELGAKPRKIRGKPNKLDEKEVEGQLAALNKVNARFYEIVVKAASETIPPATKDRAIELNRRTNFARSAASTVRSWVRAGNDVTILAPTRVTKGELVVPARVPRAPSAKRLKAAAERQSKDLVKTLLLLSEVNKEAAAYELQMVMGQLVDEMVRLGVAATKDAAKAIAEHRPLQIKGSDTLFIPSSSAVLRQMAQPS